MRATFACYLALLVGSTSCGGGGSGGTCELLVLTSGGGSIEASPDGFPEPLSCGSRCRSGYDIGEVVELSATAAQGQVFLGWGGACSGTGTCSVEMWDKDDATLDGLEVIASFGPPVPGWAMVLDEGALEDVGDSVALAAARTSDGDEHLVGGRRRSWTGNHDQMYVAAFDGSGEESWRVSSAAAAGDAVTTGLAAAADQVFAAGDVSGTLHLGAVDCAATDDRSAVFALALDTAGTPVSLDCFRGPGGRVHATAIGATTQGVAVFGTFEEQIEIAGAILTAAGGRDLFLAKRTGSDWMSMALGSAGEDEAIALVESADGSIWLLAQFGAPVETSAGIAGPGLALLVIEDMQPLWVTTLGGELTLPVFSLGGGLAAVPSGDILVAATFAGTVDLGDQPFDSEGDADMLVARLHADGSVAWARSFGQTGPDRAHGIALSDDEIYLAGVSDGAPDLEFVTTTRNDDGFVAGLDLDSGDPLWARRIGGWDGDDVLAVVADPGGAFVVGSVGMGAAVLGADSVPPGCHERCAVGVRFEE